MFNAVTSMYSPNLYSNMISPAMFMEYQMNMFTAYFAQVMSQVSFGLSNNIFNYGNMFNSGSGASASPASTSGSESEAAASENNAAESASEAEADAKSETKPAASAAASAKSTKSQTVTPALVQQLINGTYSAPYIKINGVTHYKYSDCKASDLVTVSGAANGKLHKDAAAAFKKMQQAAAKEGVNLTVVSGFRSTAYQKRPFTKKGTSVAAITERVKLSSPPGFSEHHTGYAADFNSTDSRDFQKGGKYYKEFLWLQKHAKEYGFEQSFTAGNAQGVSTEEWHYRFVGTAEARKTFAAARA